MEPGLKAEARPDLDLWSLGRTREEAQKKLEEDLRRLQMRCSKYN